MLRPHVVTAVCALRRHLGYTILNVMGLSVGLAACLLIGLYVWHETTYDRFHDLADRMARVVETRTTPEGAKQVAETAAPVGPTMVDEVPGVEQAVRAGTFFRFTVEHAGNRRYVDDYLFTEPSFADVFSFPAASGSVRDALARPGTVVLTHDAARFYFGDTDVVGRTLEVEWMGTVTVAAVLDPLPERSHLQFSMLFPFATLARDTGFWADYLTDWTPDARMLSTYVVLEEGVDRADVESRLSSFVRRHHPADEGPETMTLQPVTDIHLYASDVSEGYNADPGHPAYVAIFAIIALFILAIAVINYVNVATARAGERAREVGVRKALGARTSELVVQFLGEAAALTGAALLLGLALARSVWPAFQTLADVNLSFGLLATPAVAAGLVGGAAVVALLAGLYPALVLSRFRPTEALQTRHTSTPGGVWLRRGLVGVQFVLSIGLLIATFTVSRQLDYVQEKRLGFAEEHLVVVDINSTDVRANIATVKQEMRRHPAIQSVTASSRIPGDWKDLVQVRVTRTEDGENARSAYFIGGDPSFLETFEIALRSGRTFNPDRGTDTTAVLLNETAVRTLGLSDPVGATVWVGASGPEGGGDAESGLLFRVIGVVEDFHFQSLYQPIEPLMIGFADNPVDQIDYVTARVDGGQMSAAIEHLRSVGMTFDPLRPFEYNLLDERIAAQYRTDRRVQTLFAIAAGLAILIACVGLFGLVAFTVQQRRKEISIRKVLGATAFSIVRLLSAQYAILVGTAFVVAAPVAYLAMQAWLQDFAYRVNVGVGVLLAAGLVALVVALATVSTQAFRAAHIDPATVLGQD